MNKIIRSITEFLVFLWAALSCAVAQEKNDFLQPEIDVEIGNEFSGISNLVVQSLEAKNIGKYLDKVSDEFTSCLQISQYMTSTDTKLYLVNSILTVT